MVLKVIVSENASRSLLRYFLSNISYATGIWSSVFSLNLMDAWYINIHSEDFWHKWTRDKITDIGGLFLCDYVILFYFILSFLLHSLLLFSHWIF